MKIYKRDVENKVRELKALLPKINVYIDGRRRAVYINGIHFSFEEWMSIDLDKLRHPSFWGV